MGYTEFSDEPPFDSSMMVHFRKRMTGDFIQKMSERIVDHKNKDDTHHSDANKSDGDRDNQEGQPEPKPNEGKLLLDATCVPADIHYPTDIRLLNDSRERLEKIIDKLFKQVREPGEKRPRDYRRNARKDYLAIAKQRSKRDKDLEEAIGKQLWYLERDLKIIEKLIIGRQADMAQLNKDLNQKYGTIKRVFQQQSKMVQNHTCRVEDRIISLSQPYVRPITERKSRCQYGVWRQSGH